MTDPHVERAALALFEAMLDVPEAERDAWIAERTAHDPRLASRLAAIREADRLARLQTGAAVEELDEEPAPERIGAYRITGRIGRGGMGSVYRGERVTGDFAHVAAIKLIKPGLLSEALVERFQRERQILARLVHPHIAQLYDGGETAGGSPFIVMEHVDGLPLLQWIATNDADRRTRLALFGAICDAVGFANRNLVVHRDLTPSNVLVTDAGVVKLIDFGISRPIDTPAQSGEILSIGSLSLTPGYAAPERMVSSQVSTAADIYSLGKLLEKMLPDAAGDRAFAAILAKATAQEPDERYASADALHADVEAWAGGYPVQALPRTRSALLASFVRRNRLAVGLGAGALLLLIAAFAATLHAYIQAEQARASEAARFAELRGLAGYLIFDLNGELAGTAGNTRARVALTAQAQRYLSALAASPTADDPLRREAARGFVTLATTQGVPGQPNLGQVDAARANLDRAIGLLKESPAPAAQTAPDLATALAGRAMIDANGADRMDAAKAALAEAETRLGAVPTADRAASWFLARRTLTRAQLDIATLENDAPALYRLASRLEGDSRAWPAALRQSHLARLDRASALYYHATADFMTDRLREGLDAATRAEADFAALDRIRPNDPFILYVRAWNAYIGYGNASGVPGAVARGSAFVSLAGELLNRLVAMEANDNALKSFAANVQQIESQSLADQRRFPEAIAKQRKVLDLFAQQLRHEATPTRRNRMAAAEITMGSIARLAGDKALLCDSYRSAAKRIAGLRSEKALLGFVAAHEETVNETLQICPTG